MNQFTAVGPGEAERLLGRRAHGPREVLGGLENLKRRTGVGGHHQGETQEDGEQEEEE